MDPYRNITTLPPDGRLARQALAAAARDRIEWEANHDALINEFAGLNGLTVSKTYFDLATLARNGVHTAWRGVNWGHYKSTEPGWDHVVQLRRNGRAAAVVSEPWASTNHVEQLRSYAAERGLAVHVPPNPWASLYAPGSARFIVVTRPDFGAVQWLPEQLEFQVHGHD